ncbi:MAG: cytochrome c3 family protein, partial [Desulfobulbaceae bacterium]|nr:cytochrome c3 family protein [Desulfobulbaceae bacterium]
GIILDDPTCVAVCHPANSPFEVHTNKCSHCHTSPPALENPANRPEVTTIFRGATCSQCHTEYFTAHSHSHATTVTTTPLCINCHTGNIITSVHASCTSCHDPANGNQQLGINGHGDATINGGNGGSCIECHANYFNGHIHSHASSVAVNVTATPITANCVGCHSATIPPFTAGGEVHMTGGCQTCHNTSTGARIGSAVNGTGECINCHSSYFSGHDHGSTGGTIDHNVDINPLTDLGQANGQPCSNCHHAGNWPNVLLTHLNNCGTCHNATRDINPGFKVGTTIQDVITFAANPTNCLNCHQDKAAPIQHMNHVTTGYLQTTPTCVTSACHETAAIEPISTTHNGTCTHCHTDPGNGDYTLAAASLAYGHGHLDPGFGNPNTCTTCHGPEFVTIHTPISPTHNVGTNTSCSDCHGNVSTWSAIQSLHDVATNGPGACNTCHASVRPQVTAAINDGSVDTCAECHAAHNPAHNITTDTGCDSCHGTLATWNSIETVHSGAISTCLTCHTSARPEVTSAINDGNPDTCAECHLIDHDLSINHASISITGTCNACHGPLTDMVDINTLHDITASGLNSCDTCHTATRESGIGTGISILQIIATPGAKECVTCHVEKASGHPGGGSHGTIKYSPQCQVCHNGINIVNTIHLGNCTLCHTSPPTLKAGITSGDCMHCHGTHHGPTHTTMTGTPSCNACHPNTTYDQIVAIHNVDCSMCHKSQDPPVINAIEAGISSGTPVDCTTCHTYDHHTNAHTQQGDCGFCHADPRPSWEQTYNTALPSPLPYQMACRECHVEKTGTGLVVYKNNYYTNTPSPLTATISFPNGLQSANITGAATVAQTPVHTIASTNNQKIDIYNYGSCMACHQIRQLHHAKPKAIEYPTPDPMNVNTFPFDTLRYAPGRNIFNEFRNEIRMPYQWLRYLTRSTDSYTRGRNLMRNVSRGATPWNTGSVSHLNVSVPCIPATNDPEGLCSTSGSDSVPYFNNLSTPGPFPEKLEFTRAVWNEAGNSELTVFITNQYLQNATLTLTYGAQVVDQAMIWNTYATRWELTVPSLTYEQTVTVTSSVAGNGTSIKSHYVSDLTREIAPGTVTHSYAKIDSTECSSCHSDDMVTEKVTNHGKSCATCHNNSDPTIITTIATGQAGTDVFCLNCHGIQNETLHRTQHDAAVSFDDLDQQCDSCHEDNVVSDHVDDRGWTCYTCHGDIRFASVIASGKTGTPIHCSDCHNGINTSTDDPPKPATMAIIPGHWTPPDHSVSGYVTMESPCNTCHDPEGTNDMVLNVHRNKCGLCHVAPPVLRTGLPLAGGTCRTCHTDTSFHHKTAQAQAGDCAACHTPRGIGSFAPKQMACKLCHINSTATELEVKKFDLTQATGAQPTSLEVGLTHNIPNFNSSGTPIQIYDYKACFACHSGLNPGFPTAPIVKPFHGFLGDAAKGSGPPVLNSLIIDDSGTNPNVANMLPRIALFYHPGLETFRRFSTSFNARTGTNNYQRYASQSDYYGSTSLISLNDDTLASARTMARTNPGMTFSSGELISWRYLSGYGSYYTNPVSGYADRLPSVSYTMFGAADGPYTNVPYFINTLTAPGPYGEKISVTKADWNPVTKIMTIWAINDGLEAVPIYVNGTPMTWSPTKARWEYEVNQPTYLPQVTLISADKGTKVAFVKNTKDHLIAVTAEWDQNNPGSELHVQVKNTLSTALWMNYGTTANVSMNNMGNNNWSIIASSANMPYQVRIHSNNYGDITVPVKDTTFTWPPANKGTITQGSRTSSWDLSRDPDRLRIYVQVGADGRMPKMRLNGSGTYVDYPCTWSSPNYRCQAQDNALITAGYDPYVVIFTGASPGEGSVLTYQINNWAATQTTLNPLTNVAPTAVNDSFTVPMNSSTGQSLAVLTNDSDSDGGTLSI